MNSRPKIFKKKKQKGRELKWGAISYTHFNSRPKIFSEKKKEKKTKGTGIKMGGHFLYPF
jgi:hypothetical protein